MLRNFTQCIDRVSVFVGQSCGIFFLAAILLSVYEVFSRYVLDAPTVWTTEIIMALCGTAWMLSAGAVTHQNRHITVTVLEVVLPKKVWRKLQIVASVLSMLAVLGLMWASWDGFVHSLARMERSGSAFNPPIPTYLKVLIECALCLYLLQLVSKFVQLLKHCDETNTKSEGE